VIFFLKEFILFYFKNIIFRFDERGLHKSKGGNWYESRITDFRDDVLEGIAYIKSRPQFRNCLTGIIGHSKGGITAMTAAVFSSNVDFLVLLGSPATNITNEFLGQFVKVNNCMEKKLFKKRYEHAVKAYDSIFTINDRAELNERIQNLSITYNYSDANKVFLSPWFKDVVTFEPREVLKNITIPVLGLYGSRDLLIEPERNLKALNFSLTLAGNLNFKLKILPNLNHQFQTANFGYIEEFYFINETMSPVALREIKEFINEVPLMLKKNKSQKL